MTTTTTMYVPDEVAARTLNTIYSLLSDHLNRVIAQAAPYILADFCAIIERAVENSVRIPDALLTNRPAIELKIVANFDESGDIAYARVIRLTLSTVQDAHIHRCAHISGALAILDSEAAVHCYQIAKVATDPNAKAVYHSILATQKLLRWLRDCERQTFKFHFAFDRFREAFHMDALVRRYPRHFTEFVRSKPSRMGATGTMVALMTYAQNWATEQFQHAFTSLVTYAHDQYAPFYDRYTHPMLLSVPAFGIDRYFQSYDHRYSIGTAHKSVRIEMAAKCRNVVDIRREATHEVSCNTKVLVIIGTHIVATKNIAGGVTTLHYAVQCEPTFPGDVQVLNAFATQLNQYNAILARLHDLPITTDHRIVQQVIDDEPLFPPNFSEALHKNFCFGTTTLPDTYDVLLAPLLIGVSNNGTQKN